MSSTSQEINEYEALRQAKIARNQARLRDLGLIRQTEFPRKDSSKPQQTKDERSAKLSAKDDLANVPLRRSKRIRSSPVNYKEEKDFRDNRKRRWELDATLSQEDTAKDLDYQPPTSYDEDDLESPNEENSQRLAHVTSRPPKSPKLSTPQSPSTPSLSPNSAKAMKLDVELLLSDTFVGKTLSKTGKAHVMEESAKLAVNGYTGGHISFNKYCGVQEWGNNVLFLWINLHAPNSDVINEFPDDGRQVTWYGGSRMHEGTPVIQRLLAVGRNRPQGGGIVLWCRRYIKERKTFEPYTCLGRLSYVSHNPNSHPLAFVWKLVDYDRITCHPDKKRQEVFQSMVRTT